MLDVKFDGEGVLFVCNENGEIFLLIGLVGVYCLKFMFLIIVKVVVIE